MDDTYFLQKQIALENTEINRPVAKNKELEFFIAANTELINRYKDSLS